MKQRINRIAALLLAVVMLLSMGFPVSAAGVLPEQDAAVPAALPQQTEEGASNVAPEGYEPQNLWIKPTVQPQSEEESLKKVLLIEDVLPWDSAANQTVLSTLTEFTKVTTSEFLSVDLSEYGVIVFANDQPFSTYDNYQEFRAYMEQFASIGGVIVFGACDSGWADGTLIEALPGGVTKQAQMEYYNYIAAPDHTIVTGQLTDGTALTNDDLSSYYCSHIVFDESSLPAGSTVILRESSTNKPTLVEYPLGKGRVIASGLTWEHNYGRKGTSINSIPVGGFAETSLDDLYKYALRVSSINVDELYLLDEWIMNHNAHAIIAADGSTSMADLTPVPGAEVYVDGVKYIADENGTVLCTDYGVKTVLVTADGFRERKIFYDIKEKESRIFFLEPAKNDGLPYLVQATGSTGSKIRYPDLRDQTIHFTQDSKTNLLIYLEANWNGHGEGKFVVYQEATAYSEGKSLSIPAGNYCNFMPGQVFLPNKQVKVKMVAADGTESEPVDLNIIIDKKIDPTAAGSEVALKEGITKFDWIGTHPVVSDNEIFAKLLTTDMTIAGDLLPFEIEIEHNDDGTVTYKGIVGLVSGNKTKNILNSKSETKDDGVKIPLEETWDEWKNQIKGFKKAGNPKTYLDNLKKKYGKDWHPSKLRSAGEFDCDVAGYLEVTYDQNGDLVNSEGGLIIEASGKLVIGQTFFPGPVPLYYEFKPGVEVKASGGIQVIPGDGGATFRPDFNGLELALPSISLEGGLGVRGVATAGLEGSGKMVFGFGGDSKTSGKLKFGGAINIKVIFVVNYSWDFWGTEISLWSSHADLTPYSLHTNPKITSEVSLASRDYLQNTTQWNGNSALLPMSEEIDNIALTTLQEGVLPDAMPQLHQMGDQLVMLMLRDDGTKAIGNHTQLVYSVYENGVWSEPAAVWESDTADFFFESAVIDDQLYVVWQKSDAVMSSEDPEQLLADVAASSEICMAVFDETAGAFTRQQYLTNNTTLDMQPTITGNADSISVAWVNNDANDAYGETGTNTIYQVALKDGMAGIPIVQAKTDHYVMELCAGTAENGTVLMYTAMDEDDTTGVYRITNSGAEAVRTGTTAAALYFENGMFLWQEHGTVYSYYPANGSIRTVIADSSSASYRYVSNGTDTAIIWTEEDETAAIKASMYRNDTWCAPITLAEGIEETINFHDVILLDDGRFAMVMNTAVYTQDGLGNTALTYAVIEPRTDAALLSAEAEAPDWIENTQDITVYLENLGNSVITDAGLTLWAADSLLYDEVVELELLPGQTQALTITADLSSITSVSEAELVLTVIDDADAENDLLSFTLGQADTELSCDVYERGDQLLFTLTASNQSAIPVNAALSIYEDSFDGIEVDVKNIGQIAGGGSVQYLYAVEKSLVNYDENGRKTYLFKLSTLEEDWNDANNTAFYTIFNLEQEEPDPDGSIKPVELKDPTSVEIEGGNLTFPSVTSAGVQLNAVVRPDNAAVAQVEWSAANPDVVHVTSEGFVTPLRTGVTTITARVSETIFDTITVTVENPNNPFVDVAPGRFYYNPVMWAVENGITEGMTADTFVPNGQCTRGQVVTFLWRAAGCPDAVNTSHPFVDVKPGAFYYKAMLWAVEEGITFGTDKTHFSPNQACDRGTVVTFLHRAMNTPKPMNTEHSFTDVDSRRFYYEAMLWAVENEITVGMTDTTFAPSLTCTRGQVVTFLYRTFHS